MMELLHIQCAENKLCIQESQWWSDSELQSQNCW